MRREVHLDLKPLFVLSMLLVMASLSPVLVSHVEADESNQSQAVSALADAEANVVSAYKAVLKADEAGANVSGLLVRLNEAGGLLTRAHAAYGLGDFDYALELANLCQERLSGFVAESDGLRETAIQDHYRDFFVNVVGSVLGAVGVVCGGLFVWFRLDRRYGKSGS